ncbi:SDR family oxidoreductase [Mesorhizobium sp. BAC0120]|uniref:SDR family NAD(P)-dependent oxidoreductase n=1 Tax=Mesorhizobium sp. BAC0120 TaxID=3090670 RepID=UPI00298D3102|nr:SDR family oxidoreductase [Mesorhizobium sp. BAC0120]MDW6024011.1 SDR family oxidoreductase [Mesorhizobium sp. BAC0120]
MNIDLNGKLALMAGGEGSLGEAVRNALTENGAEVVHIDLVADAEALGRSVDDEPFLLILISKGANGLPGTDQAFGTEQAEFTRIARRLAPKLKRVVILFSSAGLVPVRGLADFSAEQAGLASLTRTLGMELGPSTVVNAVSVGAFDAEGGAQSGRLLSHTAVKRPASLSEVTAAVLFLADPDNSYMTGHTINVDGGWAAGYARNF